MSRIACATAATVLAAGLAGCGSGGSKDSGSGPVHVSVATATEAAITDRPAGGARRPAEPMLIAALGDSITAGSPFWAADAATRSAMPSDLVNVQGQYEYWARRRLGTNARFRNCGVAGQRTEQIAARFDECTRGSQVLIVQGGINDIAVGVPVPTAAANLLAMVREGKRRSLRVALVDVLPWNNGHPGADPLIRRLNVLIRGIARREHVRLYPFHDTLEDPQRRGRMREALTSDGDHPSVLGYKLLGETVELP